MTVREWKKLRENLIRSDWSHIQGPSSMGKDGQLQLCITLTLFQATLFTQKKIEEIEENFQIQKILRTRVCDELKSINFLDGRNVKIFGFWLRPIIFFIRFVWGRLDPTWPFFNRPGHGIFDQIWTFERKVFGPFVRSFVHKLSVVTFLSCRDDDDYICTFLLCPNKTRINNRAQLISAQLVDR